MSFVFTKLMFYLVVPPASLFIIIAIGFLIGYRRIAGKVLVWAGVLLLYLLSLGPVADALLVPLEKSEPLPKEQVRASAVVVLGGGVHDLSWLGLPADPSCTALARLVKGMTLSRKFHVPLILVGGNGDPSRNIETDAEAMARTARSLGFPAKDMILEKKSRNTLEGAALLHEFIKDRRIVLVTSAYHMKRAAAMFRKKGFHVIPASAGYLGEQRSFSAWSLIPRAGALDLSATACSEYVSLFWYALIREI